MTQKTKTTLAWVILAVFFLLILGLKMWDVAPIGPENSEIGLSSLNGAVRDAVGQSEFFYSLSKYLGYLAILAAALFALLGAVQLMVRKSFKKVDKDLYVLGGLFLAMACAYALFEVVVINYRPVLEDGALAASFPSSHTVLACGCMAGVIGEIRLRLQKSTVKTVLLVVCAAVMALIVIGRLLSGVHWLTDLLGGLLLSGFLVLLYSAAMDRFVYGKAED